MPHVPRPLALLAVAACALACSGCLTARVWERETAPSGSDDRFWAERPLADGRGGLRLPFHAPFASLRADTSNGELILAPRDAAGRDGLAVLPRTCSAAYLTTGCEPTAEASRGWRVELVDATGIASAWRVVAVTPAPGAFRPRGDDAILSCHRREHGVAEHSGALDTAARVVATPLAAAVDIAAYGTVIAICASPGIALAAAQSCPR